MKVKDYIKSEMLRLSHNEGVVFLGYNLKYGSKGYGTLEGVDEEKVIEMPVDEDMIMGVAVGMALRGMYPVVLLERHDFMFGALDALVNHLDKIRHISRKMFDPKMLVRMIVGAKEPINPGVQHSQEYTDELAGMLGYVEVTRYGPYEFDKPRVVVEKREEYGDEFTQRNKEAKDGEDEE